MTGRKHQLRVHCAEVLNAPILGDIKYGTPAAASPPHFQSLLGTDPLPIHLHLKSIKLVGWFPSGGDLFVESPLAPHMLETWKLTGGSSSKNI